MTGSAVYGVDRSLGCGAQLGGGLEEGSVVIGSCKRLADSQMSVFEPSNMTSISASKKVSESGPKWDLEIDAKLTFSGFGPCLEDIQEKCWKSRSAGGSKSFQSIVNSSKIAWSPHSK